MSRIRTTRHANRSDPGSPVYAGKSGVVFGEAPWYAAFVSVVYLVRHGQASFGAENYDVLSPLGEDQAFRLGVHWGERGQELDAVYSGPCKRQIDTAAHLIRGAGERGVEYPEASMLTEWDEYPAFKLFKHWIPILSEKEPSLREDLGSRDPRRVEKVYLRITEGWARGELNVDGLLRYSEFESNIRAGLKIVMDAAGRGKKVAVVTSAGPVAVVMRIALGLPPESLTMAWTVRNSSVSEFRFRDQDKLALFGFNYIPHLTDDTLITFR